MQPIPGKLIFYGSIGGIIEMIIVGAMVGAILQTRLRADELEAKLLAETLSGNPDGVHVIREIGDGEAPSAASEALALPNGPITISTLDVERRASDVDFDE